MESAFDEKIFGLVLGHDLLGRGTHTAVAARPVDHHELATRLKNALYFSEEPETIFHLEKCVCEKNGIK